MDFLRFITTPFRLAGYIGEGVVYYFAGRPKDPEVTITECKIASAEERAKIFIPHRTDEED